MTHRERIVRASRTLGLLAATGVAALTLPWEPAADPLLLVGLVALYVVFSRIEFEVGSGIAVPEQLVFVPMLFLAPLPLVPLLVGAGFVLTELPSYLAGTRNPERGVYALGDAWFAIGPVFVIGLFAPGPPSFEFVDVYVLAFGAQVATGVAAAVVQEHFGYSVPLHSAISSAAWSYRIDAILTPVAFVTAVVAVDEPLSVLAIGPLGWLLSVFSRERRERYAASLELNRAYRGTVMLLSDIIEADDHYTADHCRSVVDLVGAVADELEIDRDGRQELEFAALLHDVGKIAIPKEIINKPAALTEDEFALVKTHTIEGQVMLNRVGGLLARVGQIVRSCHERWDGTGYPDGLSGYDIPLPARIVFCCDAYSAMTTDRPYRAAMSEETAVEELWANAGTQFDPRVVAALANVIRRGDAPIEPSAAAQVAAALPRQLAAVKLTTPQP
jgi:HD-GYP domain-containing protein (c-di-GMP phosphodiesterase class II)